MSKKVLYFEGAGCAPCNDVENCRIRTAFTNKEGKKIYIEFISGYKHTLVEYSKNGMKLKTRRQFQKMGLFLAILVIILQMIQKLMIVIHQD